MTLAELQEIVATRVRETSTLDFKRGEAFGRSDRQKTELIKDITGLANGAGGRLIYGIAEDPADRSVAADFAPVPPNNDVSDEWLHQVVAANSDPPFGAFSIERHQAPGGRDGSIVIIDVEVASTAHQNRLDRLFYQRIGTQTKPMEAFQIRDVMQRRTAPIITVSLTRQVHEMSAQSHLLYMVATLTNVGLVTLRDWTLWVDTPRECSELAMQRQVVIATCASCIHVGEGRRRLTRWTFHSSDERVASIGAREIHPEQHVQLSEGLGRIWLEVNNQLFHTVLDDEPPLRWRLFMPDAKPLEGTTPFSEWCHF
jgi:hypothetical protein